MFFTASDAASGNELWVSDGTPEGTHVLDGAPGPDSIYPYDLEVVGASLYFSAYDSATEGYRLWRYSGGEAPEIVPGQAGVFSDPYNLVGSAGQLYFSARPNGETTDREVFQYNGSSFIRLTSVPSANSNPGSVTPFNGRIVFAAEDAPNGPTVLTGRVGRELWQATPGVIDSQGVLANVGLPDRNPTTTTTFEPVFVPPFSIVYKPVIHTTPGVVTGSSPSDLTLAGEMLYFVADDGAGAGRELRRTDGITTTLVADLTPGAGDSSIYDLTTVQTENGLRVFFVANGSLYVTDGTAEGTHRFANTDNLYPFDVVASGDRVFFSAQGNLWVATESTATRFDSLVPPPLPLLVSVLDGEGDNQITAADRKTRAAYTQSVEVTGELKSVDLTEAVKAALARGETRLTVRVENLTDDRVVDVQLGGALKDGRTGLELIPRVRGLVADLYTEEGQLVASGKSIIDMRNLDAGGFYLRVYNPDGAVTQDLDFQVAIDAPSQGWNHPEADRDNIHGGEGEDILVGNQSIDRLNGESGNDTFVGENIEIRDLEAGEKVKPVDDSERSDILLRQSDALIGISDTNLRLALAQALGYAITLRYDSTPADPRYLIHVPDGSERTDLALPSAGAWSQRIAASSLAELSELDASNLGINSLTGLKYAINLISLNLSGNNLFDFIDTPGALDELIPGTSDTGDTVGFPYGMGELRNLAIDFNPSIRDLSALEELVNLERLSFDGAVTFERFVSLESGHPSI